MSARWCSHEPGDRHPTNAGDRHPERRAQRHHAGDLQDDLFGLLNFSVLTLDLTPLEMLDGCGAQLIAILRQEAGQQGKQLRLEAAEGSQARHVLSLMGLWQTDHGEGRVDGHQ